MTSVDVRSEKLKHILTTMKTIAVVGMSTDPSKDSYRVADYLKQHGYRIIPVNPAADEILGEKSYPDLKSVPEPIDMVDVFRRPEYVPDIAREAVAVHAKVLWLQLEVESEEGERIAREGGLTVIQNECTMREHKRLMV